MGEPVALEVEEALGDLGEVEAGKVLSCLGEWVGGWVGWVGGGGGGGWNELL